MVASRNVSCFFYAVKKLNERAICLGVISMWRTNERKPIAAHTKAFEEKVNNTLCLRQSVFIIENGMVISKVTSIPSGTLLFMYNSYCE